MGFEDGITGVVLLPAQGYQRSGGNGLMTGTGKGLAGLFFKPVAGHLLPPSMIVGTTL